MEIDFKTIRDAFRAIDRSNSGIISLEQIKKGFVHDNFITFVDHQLIEDIFKQLDYSNSGVINYSQFLAAAVDKNIALKRANLEFAFNYYDIDGKGYITKNDIKEVFRRQGQRLTDEQVTEMIRQVKENDNEETLAAVCNLGLEENKQLDTAVPAEEDKKSRGKQVESPRMRMESIVNLNEIISFDEFMSIMLQLKN